MQKSNSAKTDKTIKRIPRTIWALGFVSLFMDISSEMIHSLLPVFLVSILNANAVSVGLIEGIAEATALISRTFSGALSDRLGKRKALTLAGYALGTLTKPLFAMAGGVGLVFTARVLDRLGKGLRGAPRDALIADIVPAAVRGAAYGLRQSLDTTGAFFGPLLALALMVATNGDFRIVFWSAAAPGVLAVLLLALAVKEPKNLSSAAPSAQRLISRKALSTLGHDFWLVVTVGSLFTLARFSEAFLLLRAGSVDVPASIIPAMLALMNIVYSLTAYPAGYLSDRFGRQGLMAAGLAALIIADLLLAFADNGWQVAAGVAFWGLHLGLTQGLFAAMVADAALPNLRGTAFGVFSMASGAAMLISSLLAGWLWDIFGPPATFMAGALFAAATLIACLYLKIRNHTATHHGGKPPAGKNRSRFCDG